MSYKDLRISVYYEGEWRGRVHPDPARHRYIAWLDIRDGDPLPNGAAALLGYGDTHQAAVEDALANYDRTFCAAPELRRGAGDLRFGDPIHD